MFISAVMTHVYFLSSSLAPPVKSVCPRLSARAPPWRAPHFFFWSVFPQVVRETGVPLEGVPPDLRYEYMTMT